ncbi:hypothetical protein [Chamaesiphon sp. OTE_8_metabat_110]|uniref:hypothetical protein n=1 Tax=Chamaesiphon sp. OTE_8_metabat_110 TaxID=2964696 RepID=UPI00286ABED0|nr:hypothetical protein [Chamaesiphon sp. OTE_8_metabat_110]
MELKLKVAHGSYIPYIVVGSKQFNDLDREVKLTTVDALIGKILAHQEFDRRKRNLEQNPAQELGMLEEDYCDLSDLEQHELLQGWVFGTEIETELEHNPLQQKIALLKAELSAQKYNSKWDYLPPIDENISQQERIEKIRQSLWVIVTTHIKSSDPSLKEEPITICLPNFQVPHLGMSEIIAEEIAELVALLKMKAQKNC